MCFRSFCDMFLSPFLSIIQIVFLSGKSGMGASSGSYCDALNIIGEYVNITDGSEQSDDIDEDFNEGQAMKL